MSCFLGVLSNLVVIVSLDMYINLVDFQARTGSFLTKARTKCDAFTPFCVLNSGCEISGKYVKLPRGGVIAQTDVGGVQFGAPPETVKDAMILGMSVPTYFVVYKEMFSRRHGTCTSELEFPAYFK